MSSSASAMPTLRVGENVPLVISPTALVAGVAPPCAARGMPRSVGSRPHSVRRGPAAFSAEQRVAAPERRLVPADRPARPGPAPGVMSRRQVLAVQRVAHLGAQRVAGAEAARPESRAPAANSASHTATASSARDDQLVAVLAGVAGAADDQLDAVERRPSRSSCSRGRSAGRARPARSAERGPCTARTAYSRCSSVTVDPGRRRRARAGAPPRRCWPRSGSGRRGRRRTGRR